MTQGSKGSQGLKGSRRTLATVVAVLAVAAATGCDTEPGAVADLDRASIAAGTVRVRADGCGPRTDLGTGTTIGDGLVVTAAHVVAGSERVEIVDRFGDDITAQVVMFDPTLDVAALRPVRDAGPPVELRIEPGREGETGVTALTAADGSVELVALVVQQRVTIRTTDIYRDESVQRPGLRVTATIEPGDSGAMVHLPGGGVGIVWSRSTETLDQAWTVDLPDRLLRPASRRALTTPVATGPCPQP